jgi:hypothetical protein
MHVRLETAETWQDEQAGCGPWFAGQECSCGAYVTGRCCSRVSAIQHLRTAQWHHERSDRHPFEAFARL